MALPEFPTAASQNNSSAVDTAGAARASMQILAGGTDLHSVDAPATVRAEVRAGYSRHREMRGIREAQQRTGNRRADYAVGNRSNPNTFARSYPVLREGGDDGGFADSAQHGHDRRQHLPRHALPLVQPVADVAEIVRLLH